MAINAIGVVSDPNATLPKNAIITQEEFLRIMLTQLRFQDPLKPADNQEFIAQLAQFSALEINRQQSEKVDSLLTIEATNQAVALVGKQVELRGDRAGNVGDVIAVSFASGEPRLTVKTPATTFVDVKLSDVSLVR